MKKIFVLFLIIAILFSGCIPVEEETKTAEPEQPVLPAPDETETEKPTVDPAAIKANEAGQVMILMYHVIGAEKEGAWKQTADNFRRDLRTLYEEGYTLVDLHDFVENNMQVPAGRTPVVITFDDGSAGHFRYLTGADGSKAIDPACAVGIMLDFAAEHPEFGCAATFYVNDRPFGQQEYWQEKLRELVRLGFSIGNHTHTHPKLNKLTPEQVQKELAGLARMVEEAVPSYQVESLALPHGLSPKDKELAAQGSYEGYTYQHKAVLLVGAQPAYSPVHKEFQPLRLPRVQASSEELGKWLEYFRSHPERRYISDGEPSTVSVPKEWEDRVNKEVMGAKELILY